MQFDAAMRGAADRAGIRLRDRLARDGLDGARRQGLGGERGKECETASPNPEPG